VVFNNRNYAPLFREQLERDVFNEALNDFYFFVRDGKYVKGPASLQTVFLNFCKYKLMGRIKAEERRMKTEIKGDSAEILETTVLPYSSWEDIKEQITLDEARLRTFNAAWSQLGERCRNLILWRKIQKLSNEEIQDRCGINESMVNNEVYRCIVRLKNKCKEAGA